MSLLVLLQDKKWKKQKRYLYPILSGIALLICAAITTVVILSRRNIYSSISMPTNSPQPRVSTDKVTYVKDSDPVPSNIKNIIVLMLENRSFDHLIGSLKQQNWPELDGLNGNETGITPNGTKFQVTQFSSEIEQFDPGHSMGDITTQVYGSCCTVKNLQPTMGGFGLNSQSSANKPVNLTTALSTTFGYHTNDSIPVITTIASEFSLIDDWFSSVPGPTFPNRHFLHCATSLGLTDNRQFKTGLPCKTIYDNLDEKNISWRIYHAQAGDSTTLMYYNRSNSPSFKSKMHPFRQFVTDIKNGNISQFTYLDPDLSGADYHPPAHTAPGEAYVKQVYDAVRSSPVWNETLLLITFDEHGGFYDHVPPPKNVPIPDNSTVQPPSGDFAFERLGVRVPTILVSPWIPKRHVFRSGYNDRNFEHSSVSATLKRFFGLDNYLSNRDAWAVSFHSVTGGLQTPRTDCMLTAPSPK
ncbi:hypothetical protein HDV06_004455 [Boothiomyces sp. JEL0866]|nr:hypothetical protein HDV06_004455 [Boothiomyces sp. JEL0866]